jgi:hypothetical protein
MIHPLQLADRLENDSRAFHTVRRPSPQIPKTIPLMQGFRTSSPKPAAHDSSTIDFVFFPEVPEAPPANPFARLRVPLLPDNYNPDRSANSAHMVETLDPAVPSPEIHIVASHPHNVPVVAPMSEVVGNDAIELDIARLAAGFSSSKASKEPSVLKEVLGGLVDDIFGTKKSPKVAM